MKKILFICSIYKPNVGGVETVIDELSKTYISRGIEVVVLTKRFPEDLQEYEEIEGIPIIRIERPKLFSDYAKAWETLKKYKDELKADVIHVVGTRRPMTYIALLLGKLWKIPVIINFSGGDILDKDDPEAVRIWEEGQGLVTESIQQADKYIAFSKSIISLAHACIPNLPTIDLVYAGLYTKEIMSAPEYVTEKSYIVAVRRLYYSKGIDLLISAFAQVKKKHPEYELYIVGDGPEMEALQKHADECGVKDAVKFMGTQPLDHVYSLMKSSIAHVCPSRSEGGGTVNIEAQAAGTVSIGSTAGGIPEYIADNETGLLFESEKVEDLTNKLLLVIENHEVRNRLVATAVSRAHDFDWEHIADQYMKIYEESISRYTYTPLVPWNEEVTKNFEELQHSWI